MSSKKTMLQLSECTRENLCVDCDDARCIHKGRLMADCPKYYCDRKGELFEDCESCDFLKRFQKEERKRYAMKHKATDNFTEFEKEMMDTIAVNYILTQSDGFQMGYAQAISDFTDSITDHWKNSDDEPQQSVLDALVDLGENLARRKQIAKKNIEDAKSIGYEQYYDWQYKKNSGSLGRIINLFTKREKDDDTSEG